jgi:hypothetical protein
MIALLLKIRNFSEKRCDENKKHIPLNKFLENAAVNEMRWKNIVNRRGHSDNTAHALYMLDS